MLKIFWNLHLWHMCVKYSPWKIINVKKQSLSINNPLPKLRYDVSRSCPSNPISYLLAINSPSIVQMTSNLGQGCTVTCQMIFHNLPIWFEIFKKSMEKLKFRVLFVKHLPKSLLASHVKHTMVWFKIAKIFWNLHIWHICVSSTVHGK